MMDNDWLKKLTPGAVVLVDGNRTFSDLQPTTTRGRVLRVTKTTVVLQLGKDENTPGLRFDINTGIERTSDRWQRRRLVEATSEALENHLVAWRKYKLVSELKQTNWNRLSISTLQAISRLVNDAVH